MTDHDESRLPARHPGGRPSKAEQVLTPETLLEVARLLLRGHYKETVADALGIDRTTWWRWEQRGDAEPESIYGEFRNVVKQAQARAEIALLDEIRAQPERWQALAWTAERRFPERWGRRLDITVRREAEKLAEQAGCTVDELLAEAQRMAEAAGA